MIQATWEQQFMSVCAFQRELWKVQGPAFQDSLLSAQILIELFFVRIQFEWHAQKFEEKEWENH